MTHEITEQLRKDLEWIVGERHHHSSPEHLAAVADRLERELAQLGCRTSRQSFGNQGVTGQNIIGELAGSEEVVLLTAHYDSVIGSPGADDNGSAVAGMLACARALAGGSGGRPRRGASRGRWTELRRLARPSMATSTTNRESSRSPRRLRRACDTLLVGPYTNECLRSRRWFRMLVIVRSGRSASSPRTTRGRRGPEAGPDRDPITVARGAFREAPLKTAS